LNPARNRMEDRVGEYLVLLNKGDFESAHCGLTALGAGVISKLEAAYAQSGDPSIRAALVRITWEFRDPRSLPLLTRALRDADDDVQKTALDGLVTVGGAGAREVIDAALLAEDAHSERAEWLREALGQLEAGA
jgi:HEAT repeat protein